MPQSTEGVDIWAMNSVNPATEHLQPQVCNSTNSLPINIHRAVLINRHFRQSEMHLLCHGCSVEFVTKLQFHRHDPCSSLGGINRAL